MLYVVTATPRGVSGAPAYDGDIIAVWTTQAEAEASVRATSRKGAGLVVVPESTDTFGDVWDGIAALKVTDFAVVLDTSQHRLVEARGFMACVALGELKDATR